MQRTARSVRPGSSRTTPFEIAAAMQSTARLESRDSATWPSTPPGTFALPPDRRSASVEQAMHQRHDRRRVAAGQHAIDHARHHRASVLATCDTLSRANSCKKLLAVLLQQRVQVLPDDVRNQRVVAARGPARRAAGAARRRRRACGRRSPPAAARRATGRAPARSIFCRTVGSTCLAVARRAHAPGAKARDPRWPRGPGETRPTAGRRRPAPTSACIRALRGADSSRTSRSSLGRVAGSFRSHKKPLGDVAVEDVRAAQAARSAARRSPRPGRTARRAACPCSGRGRAGP